MSNRFFSLVIVGVFLVTFGLYPGGEAEDAETGDEVVELTVGIDTGPISVEDVEGVLDEFHSAHPNIRVTEIVPISSNDWPDYFTQIRTLIAGGNAPDVVRVASEGIQYMVEQDMALGLNEYVDEFPDYAVHDDLHPNLQAAYEIQGQNYGTTAAWNTVVTHINTEMLEEVDLPFPDSDWGQDDFLEYAQALTREVDGNQVYGAGLPQGYFSLNAWLYNFDAAFLTDDLSESALDTEEAHEAFQFLHDLVYEYEVAPRPDPGTDYMDQFVAEQIGMAFAGRWPLPLWTENEMEFDVQYLPAFRTNERIFGIGAWPVLATSEHPEEAFLLSSFLGSEYVQRETTGPGSIPTHMTLMDDEELMGPPPENWQIWAEAADEGRAVQAPPEYPELGEIFGRHYSEMMADEISVEEALARMHEEFNEVLD